MSMKTVAFEASEESLAALDEIASNLGEDRSHVLREAVDLYLANHVQLEADIAEAERRIDLGDYLTQEQMEVRFAGRMIQPEAA